MKRTDTGAAGHMAFVVRNDSSTSDLLFQTSDSTWQAYNTYGGGSFYTGPNGRAYKVSYNRPTPTHGQNFLFSFEYPMIRFMEENGYDVSYSTDLDSDRNGALIKQHKTLVTAGHDEYWSGTQRANVKAARDAGVNLAFFAGNDMYWKTRWEPSIDGNNSANRTLVCYKETWDDAKTDPSAEWTGTWRDPRFSPPSNGGLPENELVGTAYMSNFTDLAIQVPESDGKMRLWRGTSVATQAAGATATLAPHTVGYESNEDLDNGFRPAGLIDLSTTTGPTPQYLRDFGSTVTPGTTTHHLTMYKAASGALVFSAGTVQWVWGLDANHDLDAVTPDVRMRQATVNLFADMGAQPRTIDSDLNIASASTDTTAPIAVITSPAAGASLASGTAMTITGTATDVGGRVGGIEVSTDGGQTWHPATGRDSWSYNWTVGGANAVSIQARATDDSGNIQSVPATRQVTVTCPCSLFAGKTPATPSTTDSSDIELGLRFKPQIGGWISGIRFYKGASNTGLHTGTLWSAAGTKLVSGAFSNETATGWQTLSFAKAVKVDAGTTYVASYHAPSGGYAADTAYFSGKDETTTPLTAARSTADALNGVYALGASRFPLDSYKATNYWVTPVFDTVQPPDITPPEVAGASPISGATSVSIAKAPSLTLTEPIKAGTLTLKLSSSAGLVAGLTTFDADRQVATFTPSAPLANGTTYTLTTSGGTDDAGNALAVTSSTFRTAVSSTPGVCPCSIWSDSDTPDQETANDANAVELGVKFQADQSGFVDGIRFYKGPQNIGTHIGTLWSSTGTQLATATFTAESSAGWQEVRFSSRVAVTAGTTYVASYYAPSGRYSVTGNGLATAVVNSPLTALGSSDAGGNGVYSYGAHGFPTSGTGSNYWVDVVFELPPDTTPPAVANTTPANGGTNALLTTAPRVTFSEKVTGASAVITDAAGNTIPATLAMDSSGRTATITPASALQGATTYQVKISGATDTAGNVMAAPYSWSFKTSGLAACPCTLYPSDYVPAVAAANDGSAIELGVRFSPMTDGFITGVRFYKGAGNSGTHTGSLWTSTGSLITTATFNGETATGWQQVTFAGPVAVVAGTSYVASYAAPNGHYSADAGQLTNAWSNGPLVASADSGAAPNGVFSGGVGQFPNQSFNSTGYSVDVLFSATSPNDTTGPSLVTASPVNGATSVPRTQSFIGTFDEAVASGATGTVTASDGTVVPATVAVGADRSVTVTPNAALAFNTSYTVKINGSDLAGNSMPSAAQWTVKTATAPTTTCPCSLWTDETQPATASSTDVQAVELGVKFVASQSGSVTGVRFFKGAQNTGIHDGSLWSAAGTRLANATFAGESASGWQQVTFDQPVPVTAGTTYVASYHTRVGRYAVTTTGLRDPVTRGPLTAPAGVEGTTPNGVYLYGTGGFPINGSDGNYWVDPVFSDSAAPPVDTTPPTITATTPAAAATNVPVAVTPIATFSEPIDVASVIASVTPSGGAAIAATVSYDSTSRTVKITPTAALASATSYTASVRASDIAGNAMSAATVWQFSTADVTAPVVTSTTPASGATGVTSTAVSAVFSKAVTQTSIGFAVKDGTTNLPGTVTYDAASRKATITLTGALPSGRTLTASIQASDTVGNAMAAPTTWQFATADTTAPVVSTVAATGSGTTAKVTWTTDEVSTSRVTYGTAATSLTLSATATGSVTTHSVDLTGLSANTRYYYRVISADPSGNSVTSPAITAAAAQYAPGVTPYSETTTADFTAGAQSSTYVSPRSGGDVTLLPAGTQEFTGTTVPTNWASTSLGTGSSVVVANDVATVSGRLFNSSSTFTSSRELDAIATLKPVNGQWLGATDASFTGTTTHWAAFRTNAAGALVAEVDNGIVGTTTSAALSSSLIGTSHRYEIDWTTTQTIFKVDGTTVATLARGISASMYVAVKDTTVDASPIVLDSIWVSPYAASGTYTSRVIDAGAIVDWRLLTPTAIMPTGTTIVYQVRSGPNATAGGTGWSVWTTVAAGADMPGTTRYLQYRATLTTNSTRNTAPSLSAVTLAFAIP